MPRLLAFCEKLADRIIEEKDQYLIAGCNGPYNDIETDLRIHSHWLSFFCLLGRALPDKRYIKCSQEISGELLQPKHRPQGYSFLHRISKKKDNCNGLVGQAWTIEALAETSMLFEDKKYSSLGEEVFLQHRFNEDIGLWSRLEIDGRILSVDRAFNHQLWFAACGAQLHGDRRDNILEMVNYFLSKIEENVRVLQNGLIFHSIERKFTEESENKISLKLKLKRQLKKLLSTNGEKKIADVYATTKSNGYQAFNLYAFGKLKEQVPEHSYWNSQHFRASLEYVNTQLYIDRLRGNKYGYPYNPPGFEMPYVLYSLSSLSEQKLKESAQWWVNEQIKRTFNGNTFMFDKDTSDAYTLTSRIYEILRLPADILEQIDVAVSI
ncbi:MAG: hypothetical protein GF398_21115 [Chitinivibrionales bacterium]|nr:hypothetical protein [Chitinivibrionales bacterium]